MKTNVSKRPFDVWQSIASRGTHRDSVKPSCEDNPAFPELTDTHATTVAIVHRANWIHVSATPRTGHRTHSKYARQWQSKQKNVKPQNFLSYFFCISWILLSESAQNNLKPFVEINK